MHAGQAPTATASRDEAMHAGCSETTATWAGGSPFVTASCEATLPSAIMLHCLELLSPNELACSGRLAFKDAAQHFSSPAHCTVHLSQPLPDHVADSWPALEGNAVTSLYYMTFRQKLHRMSTAATSGCVANMRVAWQLVQHCVFPDLFYGEAFLGYDEDATSSVNGFIAEAWKATDPGTAAVRAGHVRLLRWMLEHRVPISPNSTLRAAALCCSLADLQEAAQLLQRHCRKRRTFDGNMWNRVAECAAASHTPDAQSKVAWLLRTSARRPDTALPVSAASAGNIALLQWLQSRGHAISERAVLGAALEHADGVEAAEWLLDRTTCRLPSDRNPHGSRKGGWACLSRCAAASGSVAKLRWLAARAGGPLHVAAAGAAAQRGHLEAVQHLHAQGGVVLSKDLFCRAAGSGDIELVSWLRDLGCPMHRSAYPAAADHRHVEMIRWLAQEARCPGFDDPWTLRLVVQGWGYEGWEWTGLAVAGGSTAGGEAAGAGPGGVVGWWSSNSSGCLEAVRVLVGAGSLVGYDLLDTAASAGNLGLVQYLHEQGMSFSYGTLMRAAGSGCEALVEWLVLEKGCRAGPLVDWDPYLEAGEGGDLAMLKCLRELGVPWHRRALREAEELDCPLPVVQWMAEHGAPGGRKHRGRAIGHEARLQGFRDQMLRMEPVARVGKVLGWVTGGMVGIALGAVLVLLGTGCRAGRSARVVGHVAR